MSVAPARKAALRVLGRVRRDAAFSGPVLAAELASAHLTPDDSALATHLVYGVLGAEGVLDEALDRHVKGSLEPQVRDVLRLAAFELLFGRAPEYAVVSQAVENVRAARPQAAGLANAVLRKLAAEATSFPWGDPATDRAALARATAHPRWIVDRTLGDLGEEAGREALACGLEPAPTYIRLDPFAGDVNATVGALEPAGPVPSAPDEMCYRLARPAAAFRGGPAGGWFAMDAAAQMAPIACVPRPGMRILDVGAGRGNKTIALQGLATRAGGPADITALDIHAGKIQALRRRLDENGVPGVTTVVGDATALRETLAPDSFDVVLIDAPCSGLGTLRRYPEKRWRLTPDTPERMAALQHDILASAASVVRVGGRVVYSTCSTARVENASVVDGFLGANAAFEPDPLGDVIPAEWERFCDGGRFGSWPTSGGPDGHFVAAIRRVR